MSLWLAWLNGALPRHRTAREWAVQHKPRSQSRILKSKLPVKIFSKVIESHTSFERSTSKKQRPDPSPSLSQFLVKRKCIPVSGSNIHKLNNNIKRIRKESHFRLPTTLPFPKNISNNRFFLNFFSVFVSSKLRRSILVNCIGHWSTSW